MVQLAWQTFEKDVKPFLMRLRDNLLRRFPNNSLLDSLAYLFSPRRWPEFADDRAKEMPAHVDVVAKHFEQLCVDEKCGAINGNDLRQEWRRFYQEWAFACWQKLDNQFMYPPDGDKAKRNIRTDGRVFVFSVQDMAKLVLHPTNSVQYAMPQFCKLAEIVLAVIASTAVVERGFSGMNQIKTNWRNRLNNETLEDQLKIYLHGDDVKLFNPKPVFDHWLAAGKERRGFSKMQQREFRKRLRERALTRAAESAVSQATPMEPETASTPQQSSACAPSSTASAASSTGVLRYFKRVRDDR